MINHMAKSDFKFAAMLCVYIKSNCEEVHESLYSAFNNQSLPPSQLIVVFDGPVSESVRSLVNSFSRAHDVLAINFDVCRGHGLARAAAVNACQYEWLVIVDADDVSMPHRFEVLTDLARAHPCAAVIGGGLVEFNVVNGEKVFGSTVYYPNKPQDVIRYMALRSPIAQPTAMLRVSAIKAVGNYQPWHNNEDYHLWIRLVTAGYELFNVPTPVLWFRIDADLYRRRGSFKYWLSETRLQCFSYRNGATRFHLLLFGISVRFVVQVCMPSSLRELFYKKILRNR